MNAPRPYSLTPESFTALRSRLRRSPEVLPWHADPALFALVASVGLQREFGTLNDETARFIFDGRTGLPVAADRIHSELIQYKGTVGVRLRVDGASKLELRFRGIRALLHPGFSLDADGDVRECVFFPETIARIAAHEGVELVLVRDWALNTVFGGFDPSKHYYQTNFWELENNDTLRFARLLEGRQLPLLGTHDLVAHVAGIVSAAWDPLVAEAGEVRRTLEDYFAEIETPTIASLVLPYTAGVLLDDLAQPPNYGAENRRTVLAPVLDAIRERRINPRAPRALMTFPKSYEAAILLSRNEDPRARSVARARAHVDALIAEIEQASVSLAAAV